MSQQELFDIWAPEHSVWAAWAKPVLFAHMIAGATDSPRRWPHPNPELLPDVDDGAAVVIDLPGEESVRWGLAAAERGYRPVPLYNTNAGPAAVVAVEPIMAALEGGAAQVAALSLDRTAPPAFLLDAQRLPRSGKLRPGAFDNRWMTFPQDFPSASFLRGHGIRRIVVVQERAGQPLDDVCHVLRRWQEAGLPISVLPADGASRAETAIEVARPARFRSVMYRFLVMLGLRRNSAGGFGSRVPQPSSSRGGWA